LKNRIGEKTAPARMKITREQIAAFRQAVGTREGAPDEAPPTLMTVLRTGEFELFRKLGAPLSSLLHAEQVYTYVEPIRAGDELEFETTLTQALSKRGPKGEMHFLTLETVVEALRPAGKVSVGTCRSVIVVREAAK
jgi:hypothetical protein